MGHAGLKHLIHRQPPSRVGGESCGLQLQALSCTRAANARQQLVADDLLAADQAGLDPFAVPVLDHLDVVDLFAEPQDYALLAQMVVQRLNHLGINER